ncbi:hypothetical protein DFS34DRAFT_658819 [Phlyctochytrium arcticum]|nr:hypothetical protein DFS34DRAFT_658819 [Phlyctochytrium arcticum]
MQAELRAAHAENERLQNLWLETQKRKLEGDVSGAKLMDQNAFLNTQLTITDTTRAKTFAEIARHKEDAIEQQLEAAKLDAELRRLRPVVEDLRNKNEALEMQVVEMRAHMDENNVNSSTSTGMLKTEIRRLYSDRSAVRQARMTDERATHSLERKYVLAREMVEKLKAEKYELMKGQWELKARAEEMERRWMEMRVVRWRANDWVSLFFLLLRRIVLGWVLIFVFVDQKKKRNGRATSAGSTASAAHRPPWASLASTPRSLMDTRGKQEPPSSQQASRQDIQAWRLKIETLTSERTYLMNENDLLNAQLQGLHQSLATQQSQTQTLQSQLQKLQTQVNNFNSQHEAVRVRMVRAEKVAAHLERQFKEARPNARIEYRMVGDVEPSTQLLACLMPRDLPIPASTT